MLGSRRHRHRARNGSLHPALIVGICLAAAIIVTVLIGNLLNLYLDDDTYRDLTEGPPKKEETEPIYQAKVREINAYPFVPGADLSPLLGSPALSVAINTPDGRLHYRSPVGTSQGLSTSPDVVFDEVMAELSSYIPYTSGIFYPQAFAVEDEDVFYSEAVREAALLREFTKNGGSELMLCGMDLSLEQLGRIKIYLKAVKNAAPNHALGVAVPLSVAQSPDGWQILSSLLTVCDFCALDLCAEPIVDEEETEGDLSPAALKLLSDASYYLSAYDMRILLDETQTKLQTAIEIQMYPDYQIIPSQNATP